MDPQGQCLQCGFCSSPDTCGGGGTPNVCGCTAQTACNPGQCGTVSDTCGGTLECGDPCIAPDTCGGSGAEGVCGHKVALGQPCGGGVGCEGTGLCCEDGAATICKEASSDGVCPENAADLALDPDVLRRTLTVANHNFSASDTCVRALECEFKNRATRTLHFETAIMNVGTMPFEAGPPDADTNPYWFSGEPYLSCSSQRAFIIDWRLKDESQNVVLSGKRPLKCVEDTEKRDPGAATAPRFDCSSEHGISPGWAFVDSSGQECLDIDVTDAPSPAKYTLELEVNADFIIPEGSFGNNVITATVAL